MQGVIISVIVYLALFHTFVLVQSHDYTEVKRIQTTSRLNR